MIFDKNLSMHYGNKIKEGEKFLKKVKGNYRLIFLKDEENFIKEIKTKNISEILLISDGNLSEKVKEIIEKMNIPVNVYIFPEIEIEEKINVDLPQYVFENEEFLIEIFIVSKEKTKGKLEIRGDEINIEKEIDIKEGKNYFNFKIYFKEKGKKKIYLSISKNEKRIKKEFEINVLKKGPDILIICEKPLPILKILREFIKKKIGEKINIFVKVSKDKIIKIDGKIEKGEIPPESDFLIVISPDLIKDYNKILNSKKIFYFYEGYESEEIKGKSVLRGKDFEIEINQPVRVFLKKIQGKENLLIESNSKKFEAVVENNKETHILITNLFEILFLYNENLRDTILAQIFKLGQLENPEILYYEIKGNLIEDQKIFIKCFLFTPLLKPSYDSDVMLKIENKSYPMIYEGEGVYVSPPLRMKKGKYNFEINVKRGKFEKKVKGEFEVLDREIDLTIDREYLSLIARKTGGKEIKDEFEFKEKRYFVKKYELDLRKNILSYIFITLIFLTEIFFRKKEGYL